MIKEISDYHSVEDVDEKIDTSPTRKIDQRKCYSTNSEKKANKDQKDVFEDEKAIKNDN